ncbi:MAG TPA: methylglyoxal synthase [Candidatus Limnocylindria bacterium]
MTDEQTGRLRLILIAHDGCKASLVERVNFNRDTLSGFELIATAGSGSAVHEATGLDVDLLLSGPLGGDAQAGALIAGGLADLVVFFWDPLTPQPHDVDVKTLLRLSVVHDVPIACNRATADLLISSPLWGRFAAYRAERADGIGTE